MNINATNYFKAEIPEFLHHIIVPFLLPKKIYTIIRIIDSTQTQYKYIMLYIELFPIFLSKRNNFTTSL